MAVSTPAKYVNVDSYNSNACLRQSGYELEIPNHISDVSDFSFVPLTPTSECNDVKTSEFHTTTSDLQTSVSTSANIEGRRIFDVNHLFSEMSRLSRHGELFDCSFANMVLLKEERKGMASIYHFECSMCGLKEQISSECPKSTREWMNINDCWVSSMLLTGQGFSQLRDITSNLEMPCMAKETFLRRQKCLSGVIKEVAWERMKAAGEEEVALALEAGDVDEDEIPYITVVTDGAWSKRSYGTNFNALSGVVSFYDHKSNSNL